MLVVMLTNQTEIESDQQRQLVAEVPIIIMVNEIHHAIMLASPFDLEDFVIGNLLSEGIITEHIQVHDLTVSSDKHSITINVQLSNRQMAQFKQQYRALKGTSGCGLCGKTAMALAFPSLPTLTTKLSLSRENINNIKPELRAWQTLSESSGAMHAAFWLDAEANINACREDIGRHNAVDKIIGHAARNRLKKENASILVTSRCSIEIVQKVILAEISTLVCLASPTQLALDTAIQHNLNLIHIPRQDEPVLLTPGSFL